MAMGFSLNMMHPLTDSIRTKSQIKKYIFTNFSHNELCELLEELVLEINKRKEKLNVELRTENQD